MGNSPSLESSSSPLLDFKGLFSSPAKGPENLGPRAAMMLKAAPVRYGKDTKFVDVPPQPAPCPTPQVEVGTASDVVAPQQQTSSQSQWPAAVRQPMASILEVRGVAAALTEMQKPRAHLNGRFDAVLLPELSVEEYLTRLVVGTRAPSAVLGLAAAILTRYVARSGEQVSAFSVHRLTLVAFMLAHKSSDDSFFANTYYARLGGVGLLEVNEMEILMLMGLDFELHFEPAEVEKILAAARAYTPASPVPPPVVIDIPTPMQCAAQQPAGRSAAAPHRRRAPQAPQLFGVY